jgi:hypothetical protein
MIPVQAAQLYAEFTARRVVRGEWLHGLRARLRAIVYRRLGGQAQVLAGLVLMLVPPLDCGGDEQLEGEAQGEEG